jgi:hypothetical protein
MLDQMLAVACEDHGDELQVLFTAATSANPGKNERQARNDRD